MNAPTQITPDTEVKLTLSLKQVDVVIAGLLELPGKVCNPTMSEVDRQVRAQMAEFSTALPGAGSELSSLG